MPPNFPKLAPVKNPPRIPRPSPRGILWALLILASVLARFWAFRQTPFANGWDAYFYLVQLKTWVEEGRMHSPEASLIYPFFRAMLWFTGDYVWAYKIGAALLAGAFTAAVGHVCRASGPDMAKAGLGSPAYLGAWTVFSPHLTYFAAQYPKNLLGVVLLLFFIGSLQGEKIGRRALLPAMLLIINYFGHRLTFGLAAAYLVFHLIFAFGKDWLPQIFSRRHLGWLAAGVVAVVAAAQVFPGLFHVADFERLADAGGLRLHFTPYLFVHEFLPDGRLSAWWLAEILVAVGAAVVGCFAVLQNLVLGRPSAVGCWPPLLALCLLLLWPFGAWSLTGISYRMFLVFVLLAPLVVVALLARVRAVLDFQFPVAAALLLAACVSWKSYDPRKHDPNYAFFQKLTGAAAKKLENRGAGLVIAHNALAEFFTFTTGTDAMPWLPEYPVAPEKLWRIAAGVRLPELEFYSPPPAGAGVFRLPGRYFLLREDHWQQILAKARADGDADFVARATDWQNPTRARPAFLLRRKQ